VLEVHGDWRTVTRLYGSRLRRVLDPLADRLSLAALRRTDAVRTLSPATTRLVREHGAEPAASFPAYVDVDTFLDRPPRPLPDRQQALFVGVLERYKNVDGLAAAWRAAAPRLPGARLRIVGDGPLRPEVERLCADLPAQTRWDRQLETPAISAALDESSLLVLPSRSEGLPRVAIEALCRGRPVLATPVGGVPDLIEDGVNGFLVGSLDPPDLAEALVRVLGQPAALEPVAAEARESAEPWVQSPPQFAARIRDLALAAAGLRQAERALAEQPVTRN
jgi:glycosyltransferase involved in cell wall biosynthesis